jgi:hypothetical protein
MFLFSDRDLHHSGLLYPYFYNVLFQEENYFLVEDPVLSLHLLPFPEPQTTITLHVPAIARKFFFPEFI